MSRPDTEGVPVTAARQIVGTMLTEWEATRIVLHEIEVAEHPDIVDRFSRVWQWWKGDLYTHDDTLAYPSDMIPTLGLPPAGLAEDNPNYSGLCATCRHDTPTQEPTT